MNFSRYTYTKFVRRCNEDLNSMEAGMTSTKSLKLELAFVVMDNLHKNNDIMTEWVEKLLKKAIEINIFFLNKNNSILLRILTISGSKRYRMIVLDVRFLLNVHQLLKKKPLYKFQTIASYARDADRILGFVL